VRLLLLLLMLIGCGDDYMTIERRIIDSDSKVPLYFYAVPEQSSDTNTWRPVFTYFVYSVDEGEYDAYFHAYCMLGDSIIWSGVQPIRIEGGKKIWGEYVAEANFNPEWIVNVTPMAYVSIEYD
jgi:hypothetical protein